MTLIKGPDSWVDLVLSSWKVRSLVGYQVEVHKYFVPKVPKIGEVFDEVVCGGYDIRRERTSLYCTRLYPAGATEL